MYRDYGTVKDNRFADLVSVAVYGAVLFDA